MTFGSKTCRTRPDERGPRSVDEFDLDDLVVYESPTDAQLQLSRSEVEIEKDVVVRDAPSPSAALQQEPVQRPVGAPAAASDAAAPASEDGRIESLTFAERMALFG